MNKDILEDKIKDYIDMEVFKLKDINELINNIPIMTCVLNKGKFVYINSYFKSILKYSKYELNKIKFMELVHKDYMDIIENYQKCTGKYINIKVINKKGQEVYLYLYMNKLKIENKELTLVLAFNAKDFYLQREKLQTVKTEYCENTFDNKEVELEKIKQKFETEIKKKSEQLINVNKNLILTNNYLTNILKNISEAVIIIDELGNCNSLNNILDKTGNNCEDKIEKHFSKLVIEEKNYYINKLLKNKKSFHNVEIIIPNELRDIRCIISGSPIEQEENISKAVIIIRDIKEIRELVNRFNGYQARFDFEDIITKNNNMLEAIQSAKNIALGEGNVLIYGESGTGKEMFAQAIHNYSNRSEGPFIAVNCGALPRELVGSELFGYAGGAFTGAKKEGNPGKFELASGGTIFLDEIGDMPIEQQVALLRVIQERTVTRIGGSRIIPVNARIICATNKDLFQEVRKGNFREDLYYRLNVMSIRILPLRERREDILELIKYFFRKQKYSEYDSFQKINKDVIDCLVRYDWHGNVRELENIVERILNIIDRENICIEHLPENIYNEVLNNEIIKDNNKKIVFLDESISIHEFVKYKKTKKEEEEINRIIKLIRKHNGNISKIAKDMKISRSTLYRKMKKYKINNI
ncbi:sigma 54-interacting transcriptional regulator [Clostridium sp. MB40-C1]|uniref:sigma 54-interacting transcriptional regulator n=1 Tax=Clostridium sp. MB40-C1 TaxID=3070996 RepID=UPI0027E04EF5|nr:sigma 54-interacting transcriptional regulator [Clostridium sp. MB40-C1]WMJ79399.1 sigma 54-interacting transcriptional regulator [Clostridium sp. MB40-C1]